jgi:hypothetical protein
VFDNLFKSKLASTLEKWEKQGGDLGSVLHELGDYQVKKAADARAICRALAAPRLSQPESTRVITSPLHALTGLFQDVASQEAFDELKERGLPFLRRMVREGMSGASEERADDLLFVLKVLALYKQPEDVDLLAEAARHSLGPENFLWPVIFGLVDAEHPGWRRLCELLRSPLPQGFIGVAYLDFVNSHAIRGALTDHPFAAPEGVAMLRAWLSDPEEERFSHAHSATAALPFIPEGPRGALLPIAGVHPDVGVRIEAAWAMARLGDAEGRRQLREWCLNARYSQRARALLEELGYQDDIPAEAQDPDFQAMAEMCDWLAHPSEFGRVPDEIVLLNKRELHWPPTDDTRPLWLFTYTYRGTEPDEEPDTGVGMVGSITFALFGENTTDLSPEDLYGLHCCWELETNEDSRAPDKRTPEAGRRILAKHNPGFV